MLAIGAGGLTVALVLAGEPLYLTMPEIWGVRLVGELQPWVSAKDVILEMLRRHGTDGASGRLIEYHGPGVAALSVWDRHVIAHMGAEMGAVTSLFASDGEVRRYLTRQGRGDDWQHLAADTDAAYDHFSELDLGTVEPLVALPPSPGNVVPVAEVAGAEIHQAYIGSSANPSFRDLAVAAGIVAGRAVHDRVSFDINPASREALGNLAAAGHVAALLRSGARLHQAGCNGCPGMGQAPAPGRISLRTVPRNFPGRSGTEDDLVYLVSPETAAASALTGVITDPRTLGAAPPAAGEPDEWVTNHDLLVPPLPEARARDVRLAKGPNHPALPHFDPLPERLTLPVLLKMGDDVSTDEILPAGPRVMPHWSNVARMSDFAFEGVDRSYPARARAAADHAVIAGHNYGQGSSREQAALAPRSLGLRIVIALSYARIHHENLALFGVLPLVFDDPDDYRTVDDTGHTLALDRHRDPARHRHQARCGTPQPISGSTSTTISLPGRWTWSATEARSTPSGRQRRSRDADARTRPRPSSSTGRSKAAEHPDRTFLEEVDGRSLTYAELHRCALTWADAYRRLGVQTGRPGGGDAAHRHRRRERLAGARLAARPGGSREHRVRGPDAALRPGALGLNGARHRERVPGPPRRRGRHLDASPHGGGP